MDKFKAGIILLAGFTFVGAASAQSVAATKAVDAVLAKDANRYLAFNSGDTAETLIANHWNFDAAHNEYVVVMHPREEGSPGAAPLNDPLVEMKKLAYNSDAVIVGTPLRRVSALTASHQFVFSDYEISVSSVIADRTRTLPLGHQIVVTRPGGVVAVDSVQFRGIESQYPLFRIGEQYIFFLHFNIDSGSYSVGASDVFLLSGGDVLPGRLNSKLVPYSSPKDAFLSDLKSAIESDKRGSR